MGQTSRVQGRATTVSRTRTGSMQVIYHSTVVIEWGDKNIILNSGGWKTLTTKTRMNQAMNQYGLGYSVFQKDFEWHVVNQKTGAVIAYEDGMTLPRL